MALRLATRGSKLALAQAKAVAKLLDGAELVEASSDGEPGDKSRFVRAVERELLEGRADIGVHSAKDLPGALPEGLVIAGVPAREAAEDAWLGRGSTLDGVPEHSTVGTSSVRRRAQILARRPDLDVVELHGNVDTRLKRLKSRKTLDAIVLAAAGLRRLRREKDISFLLELGQMTPSAGQGAIALQTREDDAEAREAAAAISDEAALTELTAERAAVVALDASCNTPIGIHAQCSGDQLVVDGFAGLPDGSIWVRDHFEGEAGDPAAAGEELARRMLAVGAGHILAMAEERVAQS
jgi:hydroxymethylbilane synthase